MEGNGYGDRSLGVGGGYDHDLTPTPVRLVGPGLGCDLTLVGLGYDLTPVVLPLWKGLGSWGQVLEG